MVMNIIPELDFCKNLNAKIAQDYFYFSFLARDYPLPDRLIAAAPEGFLRLVLHGFSDQVVWDDAPALKAYPTASTTPEATTAMCACFRAGYHIDQRHDGADCTAGNRIALPHSCHAVQSPIGRGGFKIPY